MQLHLFMNSIILDFRIYNHETCIMKKNFCFLVLLLICTWSTAQLNDSAPRVKTENGTLEGVDESGIKTFKGVPFAAPPVGNFRWREPQHVSSWTGVRKADKFGPRAM